MNIDTKTSLFKELVTMNGKKYQLKIFITELYELMTEVMKTSINDSKKETIYQEIADCIICVEQFHIYGLLDTLSDILTYKDIFSTKYVHRKTLDNVVCELNNDFIQVITFLNNYQESIINSTDDMFINDNVSGNDYQVIMEARDTFENLFLNFMRNIKELLIIKGNDSLKSVNLALDYKLARLQCRVEDKKHL